MMYYMEEPSPSLSSSPSSSPTSSSSSSWGYGYPYPYYIGVVQGDPHPHPLEKLGRLVSESAVVIFSKSSCCMCHAVKRLLCGMGVNPRVYELDQDPSGSDMEATLLRLIGSNTSNNSSYDSCSYNSPSPVPVVFIGGKLVGAMDRVMASHINGSLVPLLKEAGALWL